MRSLSVFFSIAPNKIEAVPTEEILLEEIAETVDSDVEIEYGTVESVSDGIAKITDLSDASMGAEVFFYSYVSDGLSEIFEDDQETELNIVQISGIIISVDLDCVYAVVLGDETLVDPELTVVSLADSNNLEMLDCFTVPLSVYHKLGFVVDVFGEILENSVDFKDFIDYNNFLDFEETTKQEKNDNSEILQDAATFPGLLDELIIDAEIADEDNSVDQLLLEEVDDFEDDNDEAESNTSVSNLDPVADESKILPHSDSPSQSEDDD
jgi:hypothetical protein